LNDYKERHEKLIREATECDLIANLATDKVKADNFRTLAQQYRNMAASVLAIMASLQKS
jgi:hypothetical protein